VFRALLAHRAPQAAAGAAASVGAISVQDPRLERLAELYKPRKTTPIEIRVHDLCPSLEPAFAQGELEAMKRMDELLLVVPSFGDPSPEAAVRELGRLAGELVLADLAQVERRRKAASREKLADAARDALERIEAGLEAERPVAAIELTPAQREAIRGYAFVTDRPFVVLQNVGEAAVGAPPPDALTKRCAELGAPVLALCAALEAEMASLPTGEREAFLASYGVAESAGAAVTRLVLDRADVIPFFTVGDDECRAWPIARGTVARRAAGRVHSDIERGFIRAEVIAYDVLEPLGGDLAEARKRGLLRVEGKDYVVQDGEIVHFRFNV
jgi:ribosome-binding ATPase YchF (GTP1/OBG family)